MVPEVSITDLNLSKIGFIARDESKQAKFKSGSLIEPSFGFGSRIRENWFWKGVATKVENKATVHNAKNLSLRYLFFNFK